MNYKDNSPENFKPSEILEPLGVEVNDDTFCIMPFMHMSTTTNGEYRLCCRSQKVTEINHNRIHEMFPELITAPTGNLTPKDIWQSNTYNEIRSDLVNGQRNRRCRACWRLEDKGIVSLRQTQNLERVERYADFVKEWAETGNVDWRVPIFEFKLSNICNLRCRMCWPKDSTPWMRSWDRVKHLHPDGDRDYLDTIIEVNNMRRNPMLNLFSSSNVFVNDLMENLEHIEEMEFAGGEPLLDPLHFKLISQIPNPENVILKYSTNLTNLEFKNGRNVLDIWRNFAGIRLTISIDGYRELNSMIRHGSDWDILKQNIKQCKQVLGHKLQTIRGSTTISAMNALHLTETMDAIENDLGIRWHTSRLTVPEFLHANVLDPEHLKQQREQLLERIKPLEDTVEDIKDYEQKLITINKIRHIRDSERWLKECIDTNRHTEYWDKYQEFMNIMDEEDKHELL